MLKGMLIAALVLSAATVLSAETAHAQNTTPDPVPTLDETLAECYRCHGAGGVSTVATRPTIAGQKQAYILQQLKSFKRAANAQTASAPERNNPTMTRISKNISAPMQVRLAEAVSRLACDAGTAKAAPANPAPIPEVARRCATCHGENGIGVLASVPNLAGQQRAYLRRELLMLRETAWGAASRKSESWRSHPIMEREAARISIEDVDGLARYYASLDCRG